MTGLLVRNASVWRGAEARAEALYARGDGTIVFVGAEHEASVPAGTTSYDARGRLIVPGFVDGHAHLLGTGLAMRNVQLKDVRSAEDAAARVAERARQTPAGTWVRGAGWDQNSWPGAQFPDRRVLDAAAPEHPVALNHTSGHCLWANSVALRAAGITRDTPAPFGGAIDTDDDGEPNGILRDAAMQLVTSVIPAASPTERVDALASAIAHAHAFGVTGAHAMDVGRGEYQAMLALRDSGRLRFRLRPYLSAERLEEWFERNVRTGDGDAMLRIGGVKFYADGALGSLTAWMMEPYDGTDDTGLPLQPVVELEDKVRRCLAGGLATAIHAIGDRANREVLDLLERARRLAPELPRRIEHAQLLTAADVGRFAALGVTASVQPIHATQDMHKVDRAWRERGKYAYVFRSLLASGANVAFGSDSPVETMDPLAGIHAAVTRRRIDGEPSGGWYAGERIGTDAALDAYTSGCARATAEEASIGRIAPGHAADFVVLSHDILNVHDPMRIAETRVQATFIGGELVYEHAE